MNAKQLNNSQSKQEILKFSKLCNEYFVPKVTNMSLGEWTDEKLPSWVQDLNH
jgi:hypothetical protein